MLIASRRERAKALAKSRLSPLGRRRLWFGRLQARFFAHASRVGAARAKILSRYALRRWWRQANESRIRRQIWAEARLHHSWLLRRQCFRGWQKWMMQRAGWKTHKVMAKVLGIAAAWRWVWRRWRKAVRDRELLRKVFHDAEMRHRNGRAARGSSEWWFCTLRALIDAWKVRVMEWKASYKRRLVRRMALEYCAVRRGMRAMYAWRLALDNGRVARRVRGFAREHRARRALHGWRDGVRTWIAWPWAAHYTRVRREALRWWWQWLWMRQHARPLAHISERMQRAAFEALRENVHEAKPGRPGSRCAAPPFILAVVLFPLCLNL